MSIGQFLMWRIDLRMENGIGIGRDLEILASSGDIPAGHRDFPAFVKARWGIPRHYVVDTMAAARIVDRLARPVVGQSEPNSSEITFREHVARWGNVSAVLLIKKYSPADQLLIARKAFALADKSTPTATHVRKAIILLLGRVGVYEEDRRTRDRAELTHEVNDGLKQLNDGAKGPNEQLAIRTMKRVKQRLLKRSSKYVPRALS